MNITDESYFDHDADIGLVGRGVTLEASFINAARAMFALMADLSTVGIQKSISFEFEEPDLELALVTWLNLLLAKSREFKLVFADFVLIRQGNKWYGEARGGPWREDIQRGTEVKGATLTMLSVKHDKDKWTSTCVVDV